MCAVSNIGDHYSDLFRKRCPGVDGQTVPTMPHPGVIGGWPPATIFTSEVTRAEFDALKREVSEMKDALRKAKEQDEREGVRDCEMAEKLVLLRKVAAAVGIDLDDVIGKPVGVTA